MDAIGTPDEALQPMKDALQSITDPLAEQFGSLTSSVDIAPFMPLIGGIGVAIIVMAIIFVLIES